MYCEMYRSCNTNPNPRRVSRVAEGSTCSKCEEGNLISKPIQFDHHSIHQGDIHQPITTQSLRDVRRSKSFPVMPSHAPASEGHSTKCEVPIYRPDQLYSRLYFIEFTERQSTWSTCTTSYMYRTLTSVMVSQVSHIDPSRSPQHKNIP